MKRQKLNYDIDYHNCTISINTLQENHDEFFRISGRNLAVSGNLEGDSHE